LCFLVIFIGDVSNGILSIGSKYFEFYEQIKRRKILLLDEFSWFDKRWFSSLGRSISFVVINGWFELLSVMFGSDICVIPVDALRSYDEEFI
jgi:hypothetical protein